MPASTQTNYQSNQDYDVDILTLFKHYVSGGMTPGLNDPFENVGIDDIRAQISVSVTGMKTADLISSLNINPNNNTPATTPNVTTPVLLAQESRCHAFYRILGLPVVNADQSQFYNPGFDIVKYKGLSRTLTLPKKITIASNVGSQFEALSAARENWVATTTQLFSTSTSIEAGVLSLTSGSFGSNGAINKRAFNILKKVTGPTDFSIAHQTYSLATLSYVVGTQPQPLSKLQDSSGNTILSFSDGAPKSPSTAFSTHPHIMAPFTVDPRIDFSIWGSASNTAKGISRRVAVPFVPDATYLKVSSTSTAMTPIIESIIRQRFYQANQVTEAGESIANAQALIQGDPTIGNIPFIGSQPISNIFSGNVFNLSQQNSFADTLSTIQTMMDKLVAALQIVQNIQGTYYFLPAPNTNGPENGGQVRDVPLNPNFSGNLITQADLDIIQNQVQVIFSQPLVNTSVSAGVPDIANSSFQTPIMSFNKNTTDAQGSISSNTMSVLSINRKKAISSANNALQVIEMIMGEFSGLGLCDIVAVMGSLYTMPLASLVGFLDDDAYSRAQNILGSGFSSRSSITQALTDLQSGVSGFYQIMDQVFTDKIGNSSLTIT